MIRREVRWFRARVGKKIWARYYADDGKSIHSIQTETIKNRCDADAMYDMQTEYGGCEFFSRRPFSELWAGWRREQKFKADLKDVIKRNDKSLRRLAD